MSSPIQNLCSPRSAEMMFPSSAHNYDTWRAAALVILSNYKLSYVSLSTLDKWLEPYSTDIINFVMRKNIDKVKEASSFEVCAKMINASLSTAMGLNVDLNYYIPDKQHQDTLYMLFSAWRAALLKEIEEKSLAEKKEV